MGGRVLAVAVRAPRVRVIAMALNMILYSFRSWCLRGGILRFLFDSSSEFSGIFHFFESICISTEKRLDKRVRNR